MKRAIAACLLFATACGPSGPCKPRSGSYRVVLNPRTGNCGGRTEFISQVGGGIDPACTGDRTESQDLCRVTIDETCNGFRLTMVVDWSQDGAHGHGLADGSSSTCHGTYDVTYDKI